MKIKKISAILVAMLIFASCFCTFADASSKSGSFVKTPSEARRLIEGYSEIVVSAIESLFEFRNNYSDYKELCEIPETENGYVPQGYCFWQGMNCHVVSAYHAQKESVLIFIDAESCKKIKTVKLLKSNGEGFTGHVGGIAVDESYLYVTNGSKINRLSLTELSNLPDETGIRLIDAIQTDVKCSYLSCDGQYLYAGEFYTFDINGKYDTDTAHHSTISFFETSYAFCNAYSLAELDGFFGGEKVVPSFVLAVPNKVQGLVRQSDGSFALSTSFGRNKDSFLKIYEDVTKCENDFTVQYGEREIKGYFLDKASMKKSLRLPPMLEGIDSQNGTLCGIFESGAQKYSDAAFKVNFVCEFAV